jgi:RimJ/RimL family protein N-acetyltransferase
MSKAIMETDRLILRHVMPDDLDAFFRLFSNAEMLKYWNAPPITRRDEALGMVERMLGRIGGTEAFEMMLVLKDSGQLIGTASLHNHHEASRRAEIGYCLDPALWGRGYITEALPPLVAYAFNEWGLNRLEADIDPANLASGRSLERLGFTKEGYMPERWIVGGVPSDTAWYGLLEKHWRAAHASQTSPRQQSPS